MYLVILFTIYYVIIDSNIGIFFTILKINRYILNMLQIFSRFEEINLSFMRTSIQLGRKEV